MSATVPDFTQAAPNSPALPQQATCAASATEHAIGSLAWIKHFTARRNAVIEATGEIIGDQP